MRSEKGATAIVVASAMLVLMGFAAFAVDISAARDEQRLDQAAADAAVLAGGVEFLLGGGVSEAVDQIQHYVDENLGRPAGDWGGCVDADRLADEAPGTQCISFGPNETGQEFGTVRVKVPDQETETTFGRALGVEALQTSAVAEIEITPTLDVPLLPVGLPEGSDVGDVACLETHSGSPQSDSESCEGDPADAVPFEPGDCNADSLADAMRFGLDQMLGIYGANQRFLCGDTEPFENSVGAPASVTSTQLQSGLVAGRLSSAPGTAKIGGQDIDNVPLWEFIDTDVAIGPCLEAAAGPASTTDPDDATFDEARDDMDQCLDNSPPENLFTSDIYDGPRLVLLPILDGTLIEGFAPAYIDSIWTDHAAGGCGGGFVPDEDEGFCRHDPGREGEISEPAKSASLIVLSCDVLPEDGVPGVDKCKQVQNGGEEVTVFFELALSG